MLSKEKIEAAIKITYVLISLFLYVNIAAKWIPRIFEKVKAKQEKMYHFFFSIYSVIRLCFS